MRHAGQEFRFGLRRSQRGLACGDELAFSFLERGDIAADARDAGNVAERIADRKNIDCGNEPGAVPFASVLLPRYRLAGLNDLLASGTSFRKFFGGNKELETLPNRLLGRVAVGLFRRRIPTGDP